MINVSNEFRALMAERTDFICCADITLTDGTELTMGPEDFTLGGNTVTDGAGADGLPLGAAICRTVQLQVMNDDGHLDDCDFFGAKIRLYLRFRLSETVERIALGTFTVTEPETAGTTVTIVAGDAMYKADRAYTTALAFPATLGEMFRDVCETCDIPYSTATFRGSTFTVASAPAGDYSCRQMLGYIAMVAGGNARVSRDGRMEILSYDLSRAPDHDLMDWVKLRNDTDDILITGIETTVADGEEETTVLEGADGYVLAVDNPLITGKEAQALALMGQGVIGAALRKFEGEYIAYPLAEFMDTVRITDRKGNTYTSVITDVEFVFSGRTSISNSAVSAVRNSSKYISPEAKARIAARKLVERERTAREVAIDRLNELLAGAGGFYCTEEVQEDGGVIYYLHDKPTIEASANVMKLTAEAIGFSIDGGETYPFGFTVTGEMVMGIIQAEGLNADWVRFGTLPQDRVEGLVEGLDELFASFQVMQEQVTIEIGRVVEEQGVVNDELQERYKEVAKVFRFTEEGLIIGDSESQLTLRLSNDRLSFMDDGTEVAYINERAMYITDGRFLNSLRIGNFAFTPRDNGNLSFVRVD